MLREVLKSEAYRQVLGQRAHARGERVLDEENITCQMFSSAWPPSTPLHFG